MISAVATIIVVTVSIISLIIFYGIQKNNFNEQNNQDNAINIFFLCRINLSDIN